MELDAKSAENMDLARACLRRDEFFTAVTGRTYYAVFLKIKHYLTSISFDYAGFLKENGHNDQRAYSHGTLRQALSNYLIEQGYKIQDIRFLITIDGLYSKRRDADYNRVKMTRKDLEDCVSDAENMIRFIDKVEERKK